MFGIDSPELLVIAVVALVVIGPKELPGMLRSWGKWMAQMRGMASEFRGHVDEMVRQADLDDVKKQLAATPGLDLQALDPTREIKSAIQEGMAEGEKAMAEAKAHSSTIRWSSRNRRPRSPPSRTRRRGSACAWPESTPRREPSLRPVSPRRRSPAAEEKPAKAVAAG